MPIEKNSSWQEKATTEYGAHFIARYVKKKRKTKKNILHMFHEQNRLTA